MRREEEGSMKTKVVCMALALAIASPACDEAPPEEPDDVAAVDQAAEDDCAANQDGQFVIVESATKVNPAWEQYVLRERLKINRMSTIMCHQPARNDWKPIEPIPPKLLHITLDTVEKYRKHHAEAEIHDDGASLQQRVTSNPADLVKDLIQVHCGPPSAEDPNPNQQRKRACFWRGSFRAFKCTGGKWKPLALSVDLSSDYRLVQTQSNVRELTAASCHNGYDRCHLATVNSTPVGPGATEAPSWYDTVDVSKTESFTWQEADTWEAHASTSITAGANIPFTNIGVSAEVGTSISTSVTKSHEKVRATTNSQGYQRQMGVEICPTAAEVTLEPDDTACNGTFRYARLGIVKVTTKHVGGWWDKGTVTDGTETWKYTPDLKNPKLARLFGWLIAERTAELGGHAIKPVFLGCLKNKQEDKELALLRWELGEDLAKKTIVKSGDRWIDVFPSNGEPTIPPVGDPKYPNSFVGKDACARAQ
jgi:hypothetical protein